MKLKTILPVLLMALISLFSACSDYESNTDIVLSSVDEQAIATFTDTLRDTVTSVISTAEVKDIAATLSAGNMLTVQDRAYIMTTGGDTSWVQITATAGNLVVYMDDYVDLSLFDAVTGESVVMKDDMISVHLMASLRKKLSSVIKVRNLWAVDAGPYMLQIRRSDKTLKSSVTVAVLSEN